MKYIIYVLVLFILAFNVTAVGTEIPQTSFNLSDDQINKGNLLFYDDFRGNEGTYNTTTWSIFNGDTRNFQIFHDENGEGYLNVSNYISTEAITAPLDHNATNLCMDIRIAEYQDSASDFTTVGYGNCYIGAQHHYCIAEGNLNGIPDNTLIGDKGSGAYTRENTGHHFPTYPEFINLTMCTTGQYSHYMRIFFNNTGVYWTSTTDWIPEQTNLTSISTQGGAKHIIDYIYFYVDTGINTGYSSTAFTHRLDKTIFYGLDVYCNHGDTFTAGTYLNDVLVDTNTGICNGLTRVNVISDTQTTIVTGNYTIKYSIDGGASFFGEYDYTIDFNPPEIELDYIMDTNFSNQFFNITLKCNDVASDEILYTLYFNDDIFYNNTLNNNYLHHNTTYDYIDGSNLVRGICTDDQNNIKTLNQTITIHKKNISLIDEKTNSIFDIDNCTSAKLYLDDNQSYYDFKNYNDTSIIISSYNNDKLRFEIGYEDGRILNKYFDMSLLGENMRICANREDVTHYDQLIISSTQKPALIKNLYSNCYVAGDYTRFAYQDALSLAAYTIDSIYYLYTYDSDGSDILLASIDGKVETYINLDQLEFGQSSYPIVIFQEALNINKVNDDEIKIYYHNLENDNTDLSLSIINMDTGEEVFAYDTFTDFNEFTIYFDYSTLTGINETSVFKAVLTKTNADGETTLRKYFNTSASSGNWQTPFAAIISLFFAIFGITLTSSRNALGWLGIVIMFIALGTLFAAPTLWYSGLLAVVYIIIIGFVSVSLVKRNYLTMV